MLFVIKFIFNELWQLNELFKRLKTIKSFKFITNNTYFKIKILVIKFNFGLNLY